MINKTFFGKTSDGLDVYKYSISSEIASASIITYGATLVELTVPSKNDKIDVVLGYEDIASYQNLDGYLGATCGRNTNRIDKCQFTLYGKTYELANNNNGNNLHGGVKNFSHKVWEVVSTSDNSVEFSLFSPHLEEGFPGAMLAYVKYTLIGSDLTIEYRAKSDAATVFNPTNHSYFNLNGHGEEGGLDAILKINSSFITECDKDLIATGNLLPVQNTPFDFTEFKSIKRDANADNELIKIMRGYDVNYCLDGEGYRHAVTAYSEKSGVEMKVYTDRPAVQLYTSAFLTDRLGKNGKTYRQNWAFCLETQTYPGAVHHPHFPTAFINANEKFYSKTTYSFSLKKD